MMVNLLLRINGSSLSIEKTGEELTNGIVDHSCYLIFEGNTTEWDDFLRNKSAKVVFSTQVVDPINVPANTWELVSNYSENRVINPEYNIWESIGDEEIGNIKYVYSCIIPASVIQAPGFSINLVGYEINAETQKYSKRLSTNIVYARVYPSVVDGTLEGLNPGVDWSDLVPTAISDANEAKNTSNEAKDIATSALSEILHVKEITLSPFTNTVTKSGLDAEKAVRSSGIFNFVEGTTHTQLKTSNTSAIDSSPATATISNQLNISAQTRIFSKPPTGLSYPLNQTLTSKNRQYFDYSLNNHADISNKDICTKLCDGTWYQFIVTSQVCLSPVTQAKYERVLARNYIPDQYYDVQQKKIQANNTTVGFMYDRYETISRDNTSEYRIFKATPCFSDQTELSVLRTLLTNPETTFTSGDYDRFDYNLDGKIDEEDLKILKCLTPGLSATEYSYKWGGDNPPTTTSMWQTFLVSLNIIVGGQLKNEGLLKTTTPDGIIIGKRHVIRATLNTTDPILSSQYFKALPPGEVILDVQNLNIPNVNVTNISAINITTTTLTVSDIDTHTLSAGDTSISPGSAIYFPKTNEDLDTSSMLVRNTDITDPFITLRGGLEIVDLEGHHATIKVSYETLPGGSANCLTITDLPDKSSSFSGIFKVCGQIVATHGITAQSGLTVNGCAFHTGVTSGTYYLGLNGLPAGGFRVDGNVYAANFYQGSLYSLKENIRPLTSSLSSILKSDLCSFNYKKDYNKTINYGLIIGGGYNTPSEILSGDKERINLYSMTAFAWRAIQELNDKIVALETKISQLESQPNS